MTINAAARMRERIGQADPDTLPYARARRPTRWSGGRTAHCPTCHETFSGVSVFDQHRVGGRCAPPAELGMSLLATKSYRCWGYPAHVEEAAA
jgi:hypothetical protein